jgi:hypothetical protein
MYGTERYFSVDWSPGERGGRPLVNGVVASNYGLAAISVQLLVESLDASGGVAAWTIGWLPRGIPPFGHSYFEIPVAHPAPAYRVSVFSYAWQDDGLDGRIF